MPELLAGYGETIITPPLGTELSGYGFYLERKAESVLDDLRARTVFLRRGREGLILISCDLIGLTIEFSDEVRRSVADEHGMPAANVLLACTHTHTGPAAMNLEGVGLFEPGYLASLPDLIRESARQAAADLKPAKPAARGEIIEPIGFNRRTGSFAPIDPLLNVVIFRRKERSIQLLNYACHAVALGRSSAISADWPGAAVRAVEQSGQQGLFLQGFCGDIDPVVNRNRWGGADRDDLEFYGKLLAGRAAKAERFAAVSENMELKAIEERVRLPLAVPTPVEVEKSRTAWLECNRGIEDQQKVLGSNRIIEWWAEHARAALAKSRENPFVENVPVQGFSIGGHKILALPGEVFCEYGLNLRKGEPFLATVGYANGNVGYLPTASAYKQQLDYGCHCAPKFYGSLFPFRPDVEGVIRQAGRSVLSSL